MTIAHGMMTITNRSLRRSAGTSESCSCFRRGIHGCSYAGSGHSVWNPVLTSVIEKEEKLLIAANGAYGKRMVSIAEHACIDYTLYEEDFDKVPCARKIAEILTETDASRMWRWYIARQRPEY